MGAPLSRFAPLYFLLFAEMHFFFSQTERLDQDGSVFFEILTADLLIFLYVGDEKSTYFQRGSKTYSFALMEGT